MRMDVPRKNDVLTLEMDRGRPKRVKVMEEFPVCRHFRVRDNRGRMFDLFIDANGHHALLQMEDDNDE
jgi:hypothetical protein